MELSKTPGFGFETRNCHTSVYREKVAELVAKKQIADDQSTRDKMEFKMVVGNNIYKGLTYLPILSVSLSALNALGFCSKEVRRTNSINFLTRDAIQICTLGFAGPILALVDLIVTLVREHQAKKQAQLNPPGSHQSSASQSKPVSEPKPEIKDSSEYLKKVIADSTDICPDASKLGDYINLSLSKEAKDALAKLSQECGDVFEQLFVNADQPRLANRLRTTLSDGTDVTAKFSHTSSQQNRVAFFLTVEPKIRHETLYEYPSTFILYDTEVSLGADGFLNEQNFSLLLGCFFISQFKEHAVSINYSSRGGQRGIEEHTMNVVLNGVVDKRVYEETGKIRQANLQRLTS